MLSNNFHFLELIREEDSINMIKSKNRYVAPSGWTLFTSDINAATCLPEQSKLMHCIWYLFIFKRPTLTGYRDWNLHLRIVDDSGKSHICELQLHHEAIKSADETLRSHTYYEFFRSYYAGANGTLED